VSYFARRHPGSLPSLLRIVAGDFVLALALGSAVAAALPHLPTPWAMELRATPWAVPLVAAFFAVGTPLAILPGLVNAIGDYTGYVRLSILDAVLQACVAVGAAVLVGSDFLTVVGALALAQTFAVVRYGWTLARRGGDSVRIPAREAYTYGLRVQWGVIMKLLSTRADLLIVSAVLTARDTGLYSVALTLRDIGLLPQAVYAAPFQNRLVDKARDPSGSDRTLVLTSLLLQLGLGLAMAIAAALTLPWLIPLVYGSAFAAAGGPAVVLFLSVAFLLPASLCWMTFNSKARPELTSVILTASGLMGPLLTWAMLRAGYGLWGAAVAGIASAGLTFALSAALLWRVQGYRRADLGASVSRVRSLLGAMAREARRVA
jgi:O-antigen/teichoic acid export membrane protein